MKKVMIAVGCYSPVDPLVYEEHMRLLSTEVLANRGEITYGLQVWRRTPLTVFRSDAVDSAIENKFDWLVFLDDDLVVDLDHGGPKTPIARMISHGEPFVTTVVHHRIYPHLPMLFNDREDTECVIEWPDVPAHVDMSHLAFVALEVPFLRNMREHMDELFVMKGESSDDLRFCQFAKKLFGVRPLIDPTIKTRHCGRRIMIDSGVYRRAMAGAPQDPEAFAKWIRGSGIKAKAPKKREET